MNCGSHAQNRQVRKQQHELQMCCAREPLKLSVFYLPCSMLLENTGSDCMALATNLFSKLPGWAPSSKIAAAAIATIFVNLSFMNWDEQLRSLMNISQQMTFKFSAAVCTRLDMKAIKLVKYYAQGNDKVKCLTRTVCSRLWNYVTKLHVD